MYILQWSFTDNSRIILITVVFKFEKFARIIKKYKEIWNLNNKYENILKLFKLFITIVIFSHFFACIWIIFGLNEQNEITWLGNKNLLEKSRME